MRKLNSQILKTLLDRLSTFAVALGCGILNTQAQQPATNDLWDVSQGTVVSTNSIVGWCIGDRQRPFDARDVFGGTFGAFCEYEPPGSALFIDTPGGFTNYIEWVTPDIVTVRSFNLWARGQGDGSAKREMATFRLLAKSPGSNTFDKLVFTFTPTHPYTFADGITNLLISTDVRAVTAKEFRAEFISLAGIDTGIRVIELDGFSEYIRLQTAIRVSEVEICWPSAENLLYQPEYRSALTGDQWVRIGSPVMGNGSVMCITDKSLRTEPKRFYRVRAVE